MNPIEIALEGERIEYELGRAEAYRRFFQECYPRPREVLASLRKVRATFLALRKANRQKAKECRGDQCEQR